MTTDKSAQPTGNPRPASCARSTTPRDRRNMRRMIGWITLWGVFFTLASQLLKRGIVEQGPLGWLLALLPIPAFAMVVWAYAKFIREADELQRQIQLNAIAGAFGFGMFAITCYEVLERAGAPETAPDDYFLLMAVLYAVFSVYGSYRYR